ncbi:MAPK regulated corepressor interacting protein 2-like [Drosophila obscura]|uniref:MAPK regulated corepressor interacting protein 2-like n=1 Tax=Drosophila obscura TaxID=7282 RepID=UPI000BA015D0|nr:MAPK regulated corepressor interacting protein 2-like [Drosophila obscura]XP_022211027.1 MAPK regulated corepressor interacting protein 2-like [Drosophila obscura]
MYKINKGANKIVAKTRVGLGQNIEKFNGNTASSKKSGSIDLSTPTEHNSIPRPVFQRRLTKRIASAKQNDIGVTSPQNEDIINFISDSWNTVTNNNAISPEASMFASSLATVWIEPKSPELADFKPFDLESWWSRRLFENITNDL